MVITALEKELFDARTISKILCYILTVDIEFENDEICSISKLVADKVSMSKALFSELKEIL